MSQKNEPIKLTAVSIDHTVKTALQVDVTDETIGKYLADLLEHRKRGVTVDGCLMITHPRSNKIEVVNFELVSKTSFANTDTIKLQSEEDMYKLRAHMRTDFGIRTYSDAQYDGDPAQHTVTRGFGVFAEEIAQIVVKGEK